MATLVLCDVCEKARAVFVRRQRVTLPGGRQVLVSVQIEQPTEDDREPEKLDVCLHHLMEAVVSLGRKS